MPGLHSELLTSPRPYQNPPNQASANPHKKQPSIRASQPAKHSSWEARHREIQHAPAAPVPSQSAPAQNPNLPSFVHAGGCLPGDPSQTPQGAHPDVGDHPGSCVLDWAPAPLPTAEELACGQAGRHRVPSTQPTPKPPGADPLVALVFSDLLHLLIHLLNILPAPLLPLLWEQDGTWLSERTTQLARQKRQGSPNSPRTDR